MLPIAVICALSVIVGSNKSDTIVEIICNGEVIEQIDLSKCIDKTITIETEFGTNTIDIRGGKVCVSQADCPDQQCVKMGELKSGFMPIICLPNKLIVQYAGVEVES